MKKVIIDILKKLKWQIIFMTIFLAINSYILTCPPKIIGEIIDFFYDIAGNKQIIMKYTYYLIGVCTLLLLNRLIWKRFEVNVARKFESDLKIRIFQRFLRLKLKDIQNIKNGEIMSYFVKDINEMRQIVYRLISHGVRTIFVCLLAISQMINGVNLYLTFAVLTPILISLFLMIKIKKYIEISFKKSQNRFTEMSEYIQESTDGIRTTKAYSCEGKRLKEFIRKNAKVRDSNNVVDVYTNLLKVSLKTCFGLCYRNCTTIWLKPCNKAEKSLLEN